MNSERNGPVCYALGSKLALGMDAWAEVAPDRVVLASPRCLEMAARRSPGPPCLAWTRGGGTRAGHLHHGDCRYGGQNVGQAAFLAARASLAGRAAPGGRLGTSFAVTGRKRACRGCWAGKGDEKTCCTAQAAHASSGESGVPVHVEGQALSRRGPRDRLRALDPDVAFRARVTRPPTV